MSASRTAGGPAQRSPRVPRIRTRHGEARVELQSGRGPEVSQCGIFPWSKHALAGMVFTYPETSGPIGGQGVPPKKEGLPDRYSDFGSVCDGMFSQ
jgi:hypothetical protein